MIESDRDQSLDTLLDLDGQVFIVDPAGKYWVKFMVKRVAATLERPHGLNYSFMLHDEQGERLVGFDNAHPVRRSAGLQDGQVRPRITSTIIRWFGPMNIEMQRACWRISGRK